jgi:methionyl-tRNA formyltransferase
MSKSLKIVYFGTCDFAIKPLEALTKSQHSIEAVVTQPDSKAGRRLCLISPEIKDAAHKGDLRVIQCSKPKDNLCDLEDIEADIFIVCSYGNFLPGKIFNLPKLYSLNIHPSILPKYRGAAPINWALINGDKKTGVSIFKVSNTMDAGDVAEIKELAINEADNAQTLSDKLSHLAAEMIVAVVDKAAARKLQFTPQDDAKATYARCLKKADGQIDWDKTAEEIHNLIRGLYGWPGAYFFYNKKRIKVYESKLVEIDEAVFNLTGKKDYEPGEVALCDNKAGLVIKCHEGFIRLIHIQQEGKKAMADTCYIAGSNIKAGDRLQ